MIILDGTNGETFPSWTTVTRPASPNAGQTGYNTTLSALESYNGTTWISIGTVTNALTIGTGLSGTSFNGSSAVTIAIDSTVATLSGTQTITNKRINPRVSSAASPTSPLTPDFSSYDVYAITGLTTALTINAPTGTPVDGNKLIFRILDNGTARALTWNATYTVIGVTLPTTTVASKTMYVGCIYNANNTRWDVIAVTTQA